MIWFLQIAQLSTTISAETSSIKTNQIKFQEKGYKKVIKIGLKLGLGNSE